MDIEYAFAMFIKIVVYVHKYKYILYQFLK